jgi:hypothetical protein
MCHAKLLLVNVLSDKATNSLLAVINDHHCPVIQDAIDSFFVRLSAVSTI